MHEEPETDSETCERLEKIEKLIARRNELAHAKRDSNAVIFSYHNPRKGKDCFTTFIPSAKNQPVLKEMFQAELDVALRQIDAQLAEFGIVV